MYRLCFIVTNSSIQYVHYVWNRGHSVFSFSLDCQYFVLDYFCILSVGAFISN